MADNSRAWMAVHTKGSKQMRQRLNAAQAKNPAYQEFIKKHGLGDITSAKQSEMSVKRAKPASDETPRATGSSADRLAAIKAAAEKARQRKELDKRRAAMSDWGGTGGKMGGFSMPSFRTYREEVEQVDEMDKSQPAAGRDSDTPFPKSKIKLTGKQRESAKLMTGQLLKHAKEQLKKEEVEQVDEGTVSHILGKITHILPKHQLKRHEEWMESEGYPTNTVPLPDNHPKAKTHIGIVSPDHIQGLYHEDGGADRIDQKSKKDKKKMKEETELDEVLMHDRYLRSHGKKARGTGSWAFTTKQYGEPKEHEMVFTSSQKTLGDAHKEASKKLGTKHLYVMEEVEQMDEAIPLVGVVAARLGTMAATRAGGAAARFAASKGVQKSGQEVIGKAVSAGTKSAVETGVKTAAEKVKEKLTNNNKNQVQENRYIRRAMEREMERQERREMSKSASNIDPTTGKPTGKPKKDGDDLLGRAFPRLGKAAKQGKNLGVKEEAEQTDEAVRIVRGQSYKAPNTQSDGSQEYTGDKSAYGSSHRDELAKMAKQARKTPEGRAALKPNIPRKPKGRGLERRATDKGYYDKQSNVVGSGNKSVMAITREEVELQEQFKTKEAAHTYAIANSKDGYDIDVYKHPNGSYHVNHEMNSQGRNWLIKAGAKKVGVASKGKIKEEVEYIEEKLTAADPASTWISDFVNSDNPRFEGKSKKKRMDMALGAYYAAQRSKNEEVVQEKLDPVGKETIDIDNDKDVDKTDRYLHARRQAIGKAIARKKGM